MSSRLFYPELSQDVFSIELGSSLSYHAITQTIALMMDFPLRNDTSDLHTIEITGFEKTFWSTKQCAYLKIELIDDLSVNPPDIDNAPEYANVFLGHQFNSKFTSYKLNNSTYWLANHDKRIISYGYLALSLKAQLMAYSENDNAFNLCLNTRQALKSLETLTGLKLSSYFMEDE